MKCLFISSYGLAYRHGTATHTMGTVQREHEKAKPAYKNVRYRNLRSHISQCRSLIYEMAAFP